MTESSRFFQVKNISSPISISSTSSSQAQTPWEDVSFSMNRGDVILVQGSSGCGKTTLLKCLADLIPLDNEELNGNDGEEPSEVRFQGLSSTSPKISPSFFRSRVSYIPQRPSLYPGTPLDFLNLVSGFKSNRSETLFPSANDLSVTNQDIEAGNEIVKESTKGKGWKLLDANPSDNALQIPTPTSQSSRSSTPPQNEENQPQFTIQSLGYPLPSSPHLPSPNLGPDPIFFSSAYWNLPTRVWRSDWSQISGGEAQRAGLAIGLGMKIRQKGEGVLLLDEPTSALDLQTTYAIERTLLLNPMPLTIIWITHSDEQSQRVSQLVQLDNSRRKERGENEAVGERRVRTLHLGEALQD